MATFRRMPGQRTEGRLITGAAISALLVSMPLASAAAETRTFDFDDFNEVDIAAGVDATVTVGSDFAIAVEADEKDLERLRIEVKDRTLKISREYRGMSWSDGRGKIVATISMPTLVGIEASSGASVVATGIDAGAFAIETSSGGSAEATGRCESLDADASSGSRLDAEALQCARVVVDASSGASVRAYADEEMTADASSGASVKIFGDPARRDVSKSSGASVSY